MEVHVSRAPRVTVLEGAVGSDTGGALAGEAAELLGGGTPAPGLLVLAASPDAAVHLRGLLAEKGVPGAGDVEVTTPLQYALRVLADDAAFAVTGREGVLLAPHDVNVLLEDLKVSGARLKRLRGMLRLFYRGLSEMSDRDPDWLCSQDEADTFALLVELLRFTGGVLPCEAAGLAWAAVTESGQVAGRFSRDCVLVDGYQNMSRASQALACALARERLTVAFERNASIGAYDEFSYEAGVDELLACNPQAQVHTLDARRAPGHLSHALELVEEEAAGAGKSPFMDEWLSRPSRPCNTRDLQVVTLEYPKDEAQLVVELVRQAAEEGVRPGDLFVVSPNATWDALVARALMDAGVGATKRPEARSLKGDVRDVRSSLDSQIYTALQLVADDFNRVAWRTWCGYGDWLANSTGFAQLRTLAREGESDIVNTLEYVSRNEDVEVFGREQIVRAYHHGREVIAKAQGLTGGELLEAVVRAVTFDQVTEVPASARALFLPCAGATAGDLLAAADRVLYAPTFTWRDDAVRIGRATDAYRAGYQRLIWVGFVNGFVPGHDYFDSTKTSDVTQRRLYREGARQVLVALSAAEQAAFSHPQVMDALSGAKLGAVAERIRSYKGERVYVLQPSEYAKILTAE